MHPAEQTIAPLPDRSSRVTGRVLILADDTRIVLPITRSLGRRGLAVHVGWCPERALALRSRFIRRIHQLPACTLPVDRWWCAIAKLINEFEFDLVLPASETASAAFDRARHLWKGLPSVCLLNVNAFDVAKDKQKTLQLARSLGIPVPKTIEVQNRAELREALRAFDGQAFVKPLQSVSGQGKNYVRRIETLDEGDRFAATVPADRTRLLVQKVVSGRGLGVEVLADRGNILVAFQHERLHETTGHGSMYRRSMTLDAQLLDYVSRMVAATNYTGVGMFEFRQDLNQCEVVLLEINGRFWGSLELALLSGVDFPHYVYQWHVNGHTDFVSEYRVGTRSRDLSGDLRWLCRALRGSRPDLGRPQDESYGWDIDHCDRRWLWRNLASLFRPGDHIDSFAWDDAMPAVHEIVRLGTSIWSRLLPGLFHRY